MNQKCAGSCLSLCLSITTVLTTPTSREAYRTQSWRDTATDYFYLFNTSVLVLDNVSDAWDIVNQGDLFP